MTKRKVTKQKRPPRYLSPDYRETPRPPARGPDEILPAKRLDALVDEATPSDLDELAGAVHPEPVSIGHGHRSRQVAPKVDPPGSHAPVGVRANSVYLRDADGMAETKPRVDRRDPVMAARIPRDVIAAVDKLRARDGRSRSEIVREALAALLDQEDATTAA